MASANRMKVLACTFHVASISRCCLRIWQRVIIPMTPACNTSHLDKGGVSQTDVLSYAREVGDYGEHGNQPPNCLIVCVSCLCTGDHGNVGREVQERCRISKATYNLHQLALYSPGRAL